ncbi:RF-1 domain-containing protein [Annulohypoxylon maeteangense]|uniref:RF-1 domain-containing protein n=1 Tax=Annulohypoxylon maeteangense TaxID=1927788 RepID=UPI0020077F7A|nr:RF-1 domain-containing protein [Annulohypoxylon maeteangense]KAI0884473.1 RF-1 domain-containing protein [Annulohypoxylon maeteangense]
MTTIPTLLRPLRSILAIPSTSQRSLFAPTIAPRLFLCTSGPLLKSVNFPPRPKPPPEEEIEESFLKGSGPGGQKINKTNSAVQLKHLPSGIVVKCQATRSRSQNRTIARRLLAEKLDNLTLGDQSRSSVVGQVKRKKKASSAKKSRRKYRKLEEGKAGAAGEETLEEEEDVDEEDGEFKEPAQDEGKPNIHNQNE